MVSESFVSQNCVLVASKFRNWMFVWILTVARRTLGPTCVFIWTQFLFNTTFCWSATILTLVNNLYRIFVNTLWITIKPAGRSDRISKSNLQNLYSWTVRQFKMLIFHHRRYVLNLNNTDILPLRLFVPIIAEISNCQTKSIFILWNKCLLTCFLGDIFWQIWSRNLFTPCWPLIFYAPLSHHTVLGFICTLCSFLDLHVFFLRNSTLFFQEYFPLQAPFQNLIF